MVLLLSFPFLSHSQDGCVSTEDQSLAPTGNGWIGHVYQLQMNTLPNVKTFTSAGEYKGTLRSTFLPLGTINFVSDFGNYGAPTNDNQWVKITNNECETRLSYFAVLFRGKYTLPATGTYKITVTSDDGSTLSVNKQSIHNKWVRQNYNDLTAKSYFITNVENFVLDLELRYYESDIYNKVGFNIERYYGPGVISGNQKLSGINPDPTPFISMGPAAFSSELAPLYQWQYSNTSIATGTWTNIARATGEIYDIPAFSSNPNQFQRTRYFRRIATDGITEYISNVLNVNLCKVNQVNHSVYGVNKWIGYVYKGTQNFNENDFLGRVEEKPEFAQNFTGWETDYPTLDGCSFYTDQFSIRYKMKIWVEPGSYDYVIWGDDGFRLTVSDGENFLGNEKGENPGNYAIYNWTFGGATEARKRKVSNEIVITEGKFLYFDLEYFDNVFDNYISFTSLLSPFIITPLEWGQVQVQPCEQNNCLSWETLQEKNTSHFELERSYDGLKWEMFDQSVSAQGYSTAKTSYAYTDKDFLKEQVYYRIKQVDLDELFGYSTVVRVNNAGFYQGFTPFPNPTTDKIRFSSKEEVTKLILTSNDYTVNRELKVVKIHEQMYEVDLIPFKNGNYVLTTFTAQGDKNAFKVIKK